MKETICRGTMGTLAWTLENGTLTIGGTGAVPYYNSDFDSFHPPWYPYRTSIQTVDIKEGVTSIGDGAFSNYRFLTSILVEENHQVYSSVNGVLFNKAKTELIRCPQGKSGEYVIPNSVTSIGGGAFSGCTALTSILVEENHPVYSSVNGVLFNKAKTELILYPPGKQGEYLIPNSVTSIGDWAFSNCRFLTSILVEENHPVYSSVNGVLFNKAKTELILCPQGKSGEYVIPNSVTSIGGGAFPGCTALTSILVEENHPVYSSVNGVLFNKAKTELILCPQGKSGEYVIPNSVTSIGDFAFSDCRFLTSITIPNSVTSIGNMAFYKCSSLTSITIPNSVTSIGNMAFFKCSSLTSITIPNSVTSIGGMAFFKCSSLTSITIPNSVTRIRILAFSGCSSLTSILVEENNPEYSSLDGVLFNKYKTKLILCPNGKSGEYIIPNSVASIEIGAFSYCSSLTSVTIPNSVTSIGYKAFSDCSSLTSITIPNLEANIGDGAFYACRSLTSIIIPNSVTTIECLAFSDCTALTSFLVEENNPVYSSLDGVLFNKDKTELIFCPQGKPGEYIIPNSVTSIGDWAFLCCSALTTIAIPNSVTTIGEDAFSGCSSLTSILVEENNLVYSSLDGVLFNKDKTELILCLKGKAGEYIIPNSVTSIGDRAFSGCSTLTSILVEENNPFYSLLDGVLFNKDKTELILCPKGKSGEYIIPNSVKTIGNRAFYRCDSLTSIIIPNSVTSIGGMAFFKCSSLTSITIPNSVASIGNMAFDTCYGLKKVIVKWEQPIFIWCAFGEIPDDCILEVPQGAKALYENAEGWKDFAPNIRGGFLFFNEWISEDELKTGDEVSKVIKK